MASDDTMGTPLGLSADGYTMPGSKGIEVTAARRRDRHGLVAAGGLQANGALREALVPEGLGPVGFLKAMRGVSHPMEAPPVLPEDVMVALRAQGADAPSWTPMQLFLHGCQYV